MWVIFALFLVILGISVSHHELWGDELHSWNIAKASHSYIDLVRNSRFEGHPPLWYTLMWLLSKGTHNLAYLQGMHFCIISTAVYILLFHSPFPQAAKALIPFGYFFLFEYGTLSRNYAIGVLLAFCICLLLQRKGRISYIVYYLLLLLLSNTHLLGLILAAALHLYFLLHNTAENQKPRTVVHILLGCIFLAPAVYFIFPPADSQLNMHFWMTIRSPRTMINMSMAPANAFLAVPEWWNYHFWNTNFLQQTDDYIRSLLSLLLTILIIITLRKSPGSLLFFFTNLLFTCAVEMLFSMTSTRYVGFLFISFIIACWLHYSHRPLGRPGQWVLYSILIIQVCGSTVAVSNDIQFPFSNAGKVNRLLQQIPPGEQAVSDYWCLNNVAAYVDTPFYCIEFNREISFLLWNQELSKVIATHAAYTNGFNKLFRTKNLSRVWMISTNTPEELKQKDAAFPGTYHVQLVNKTENAIEPGGELYLYIVSK